MDSMRLAVYKQTRHTDDVFNLAENLLTSIAGILTAATVQNQIVWKHLIGNTFSAEFFGLELSWDRPNNEPPTLTVGETSIQDDGSCSYGFSELEKVIQAQYELKLLRQRYALRQIIQNDSTPPPIITCRT